MYWDVPEDKRESDVHLTTDSCVIAGRFYFIRGCIDIPIIGTDEVFTLGAWGSLKEENFFIWQDAYALPQRAHIGPFFSWLCSEISLYPSTISLKTHVHLRDNGIRPYIEIEPSDHPMAQDQRNGITMEQAIAYTHRLFDANGLRWE